MKYPDAARNAGVQGTVVLRIIVAVTGEVKEVAIIDGDPLLAQPTAEAVRQWKYKPYTVDGVQVEMETQVSANFRLKPPEHAEPPLGTFRDDTYSNDLFDLEYPLSRDWVRETEAMRKRIAEVGQSPGMYVLLAAVHIPQQTAPLEADSSFVLSAFASGNRSCEQYLQNLGNDLHSRKEARQKGEVAALTIAGRDFSRADFDFRENPTHHTFLCTQSKGYLLQWNLVGLSKGALEAAINTLASIGGARSQDASAGHPANASSKSEPVAASVKVAEGVSRGLLLKKVQPVYPEQARYARIQGTVRMTAVISKTGDVVDLEVVDGPIELVVSAVNAVRQWKYRPYLLNGEPVAVRTPIIVNYTLSL